MQNYQSLIENKIIDFIKSNESNDLRMAYERVDNSFVIYFDGENTTFIKRYSKFFREKEIYDIFTENNKQKVNNLK